MSFRAALIFLCLSHGSLDAQSEFRTPRAAVVRYQSGALHSLYGLGSSYVVDRAPAGAAAASVFSDRFGLIADGTSITLVDEHFAVIARTACTEAKPILAIGDSSNTAVAWLPSQSALVRFNGHEFLRVAVTELISSFSATAISTVNDSTVRLLQSQGDGAVSENLISTKSGEVISSRLLAEAHGQASYLFGSVVSIYEGKLHAIALDGYAAPFETSFDATAVTFEQCSSQGLHIASTTDARNWILYREGKQFVLAELPAVPQ